MKKEGGREQFGKFLYENFMVKGGGGKERFFNFVSESLPARPSL